MNIAAESEENQKNIGSVRLFLIQNVGLLTGFGVILTCEAIYFEMSFNENNNLTILLHNKNKN